MRFETSPPSAPFGPDLGRAGAYGPKDSIHVYLPPAEFLWLTASPPDGAWGGKRNAGKIDKYARFIQRRQPPVRFPVLWLLVTVGPDGTPVVTNHEGRHRAAAALACGVARVPVAVIWGPSTPWGQNSSMAAAARGETTTWLSQGPTRWWPHAPVRVAVHPGVERRENPTSKVEQAERRVARAAAATDRARRALKRAQRTGDPAAVHAALLAWEAASAASTEAHAALFVALRAAREAME